MSSPSDYSFMRSGTGASSVPVVETDVMRRLICIVMTMIAAATETAAMYAEHAGRRFVAPEDVHHGLRYQAREFFKRDNLEEEIADMECDLYETDDDDSCETSSEEDEEDEEDEEKKEEKHEQWTRSSCDCDACVKINSHFDTWDLWEPTDEAEIFVKRSVDKTTAMHVS
jgi:hypothetical protein